MVLFLHNRYRTTGGEERVVEDLLWLVREHLGEEAELLAHDSAAITRGRAAIGLLRGGLDPRAVADAVRRNGARIVHAHNLHPGFGWRALAAARREGAAVVLHLHQYRLVCAVGVCFTHGRECTRCHGRNTLPGIALNCRANVPEAAAYATALAAWQRRLVSLADVILVPSRFARERLAELGAPLPWERVRVLAPPLRPVPGPAPSVDAPAPGVSSAPAGPAGPGEPPGPYALVVSRLAPEKGIDVAIGACRRAGIALVVAGEGPERARLQALAQGADVRLLGAVDDAQLARLRAGAAVALAPSRSAETFGMALAEAMAAGVPVLGSRIGALPEILAEDELVEPADERALARAIHRQAGNRPGGERARERIAAVCGPGVVAAGLRAAYAQALEQAGRTRARRAAGHGSAPTP
jgi:glycosyltransferase involved in cell wall biosynthesis